MCKTDPDVVKRAADKLVVHSREPKKIDILEYDGTKWVKQKTVTSGGSARGNTIWINRGEKCHKTKATVYHEVLHTKQPASMSSRDKEIEAHTLTEKWTIERKLPGRKWARKKRADGTVVADEGKIKTFIDKAYGYSAGKPRIVARSRDGKKVKLEDGTVRAAEKGDRIQHRPPQDLREKRIDPDRLKCH